MKHINKINMQILTKINNYISRREGKTFEKLSVSLKTPESLSIEKKLSLPLKIQGKMLGVGRHKDRFYTEEDLKWSVEYHKGKKIPVKLDHRHLEIGSLVGVIDNIFWDDIEKVVRYKGHINDETQARNIIDKIVNQVSATIFSVKEQHPMYGLLGRKPEYNELSLVIGGSFKNNTLEPVLN